MKTYFIGLGGTGLQTVAEIRKRLKKSDANFDTEYAFTFIDTDGNTKNSINSSETLIPGDDFIDIGNTIPKAIYIEAHNKQQPDKNQQRLLQWAIDQKPGNMNLLNKPLHDGAGAIRNMGRFGIYHYYERIESHIKSKIEKFSQLTPDNESKRDVDIWVIASSCGGTGSSILLDILYMLNYLGQPIANGEPNVKLVLFMPQAYVERHKNSSEEFNYYLNAYACLKEIDFFRSNFDNNEQLTYESFAVRPVNGRQFPFPLFQYMIPICYENDEGKKINLETQLFPTVAEMVYYLNTGEGRNFTKSTLINTLPGLENSRPKNATNNLIGYGYRAIQKPNKELKEYLTRRALYEIVDYLLDKTLPSNFENLVQEFAQKTILSKLVSLSDIKVEDQGQERHYMVEKDSKDSVEVKVKSIFEGRHKSWNCEAKNMTTEILTKATNDLSEILKSYKINHDIDQIVKSVNNSIENIIDTELKNYILKYGLALVEKLLDIVDDGYLEPLNDIYISEQVKHFTAQIDKMRKQCEDYSKKGFFTFKKEVAAQSIKQYKDAIVNYIIYDITKVIIEKLTKSDIGYLENLRKGGGKKKIIGIRGLIKKLNDNLETFRRGYNDLQREFRETSADVMTIYIPSLAEIATGDKYDWKVNNLFDRLYRESIVRHDFIPNGSEQKSVPVRESTADGLGMKNILEQVDISNPGFVNMIKEDEDNVEQVKKQLIEKIFRVVKSLVDSPTTAAGQWLAKPLSEAINNPSQMPLPNEYGGKKEKLFERFKNSTNNIHVFFPLTPGGTMPNDNCLLFVGDSEEFASQLGYEKQNDHKNFRKDQDMHDRFVVIRMPSGLRFDMYKYFSDYELYYNSHINMVYNKSTQAIQTGCYLDQRFNRYGLNLEEFRQRGLMPSIKSKDQENIEERLKILIKCLFYQHIVDIFKEKDNDAYSKIFGFTSNNSTNQANSALDNLLGTGGQISTEMKQFIKLEITDLKTHTIKLTLASVKPQENGRYLEISSEENLHECKDTNSCHHLLEYIKYLKDIDEKEFFATKLIEEKITESSIHNRYLNIKDEAKKRLTMQIDENGNPLLGFGTCIYLWQRFADNKDKELLKFISTIIEEL